MFVSVRECSGRFGSVRSAVGQCSVVFVSVRECSGRFGHLRSVVGQCSVVFVSVRECSGVLGSVWSCSSRLLRAGSVAAPGTTRSGSPDDEVYASPRINHGSAHPLALDVGNHQSVRCVVVDEVQWPPQVELGQGHLTPRSTLRRGPIMGAPIHWYSAWVATGHLSGHRLGGQFLEDPEQHSVRGTCRCVRTHTEN